MAVSHKKYKVEMIDNFRAFLEKVPEKPKSEKEISASDALASLKTQIRTLQAKGYTLEEILTMFKENGIDAGMSTLKNAIKKPRPKKQTTEVNE